MNRDDRVVPIYSPESWHAAPAEVLKFPAMSSRLERELLYNLARTHFRGDGLIVDAGIFLGGSTKAFAAGLRANPDARKAALPGRKPINSYDIAIWVRSMDKHLASPAVKHVLRGRSPKVGRDFSGLLKRILASDLDLVDLRIGDIVELARADAPIEIAFYDCLKTKARDWAAFKAFGPFYVASHTILVQQDFFFAGAPYNKIRQEFLRPYFSFLGGYETSAVFKCESPLPKSLFESDPIEALSMDERLALLQRAAELAQSKQRYFLTRLSCVDLMIEDGLPEKAEALLESVKSEIQRSSFDDFADRVERNIERMQGRVARALSKSAT